MLTIMYEGKDLNLNTKGTRMTSKNRESGSAPDFSIINIHLPQGLHLTEK
jgi:hypothetical protein